ncbi:hypothetical protein [Streptococcus oralis]|jgi:membrane protein|uniref:Uncharacterized protein n=1 Tax=Streptococcus oralis subsp. dentisani TaxID=1458253 RepID=A0A1X1J4V8_STROR|nr:hypothetical protein [Streptococcus oralis]ORO80427.1 hypothetical protein B7709_00550 [Streptococcus oralis subsp. dentisani]
MEKFYYSITLLFLSRQGYWNDSNNVKELSLIQLTYKYFLSSIALVFIFLIAKSEIYNILKENQIWGILSYFELATILVPAILLLGILYENIYVLKTKTESTMRIFFNITGREFWNIVFFKNLILVLPILVIIFFYNISLGIFACLLVFLLNNIFFIPKIRYVRPRFKKSFSMSYLLSVVDGLTVFKAITIPVFSTFMFMFMWLVLPDFLGIDTTNKVMILNTALFSGTVFFSNKGINFYFLTLNKDFPYLKAVGINLNKFIKKRIWSLNVISILVPATSLYFFLNYLGYGFIDIFLFLFGVSLAYFLCQGVQMIEVLLFREYHFRDAKELEAFSLPLKMRVTMYIIRFLPILVCLLVNQIRIFGFLTQILLNIIYIGIVYFSLYRYTIIQVIKGDNNVHFIHEKYFKILRFGRQT